MTWYANSAGRYGESGAKGDSGERLVNRFLTKQGHKVEHLTDRHSQVNRGIDFLVDGIPVDVKTNGKYKTLTVEISKGNKKGWLYTSEAKFIFGVDLYHNEIYVYSLAKMQKYVEENLDKSYYYGNDLLIKVPKNLTFIKRLH